MSYLHVTIKTKSSDDWLCIFKDLSISDLKINLVKPYRLGKSIFYGGNILSPSEITQVKITETKQSHEEELKLLQEESYRKVQEYNRTSSSTILISAGCGYSDYEINDCGKDVTNLYITSGPGVGTPITAIAEFIKHPLVVYVFGGLMVLALTAYFGLK